MITAFQLDHERGGALRASGAEFLPQGWFVSGPNDDLTVLDDSNRTPKVLLVGWPMMICLCVSECLSK